VFAKLKAPTWASMALLALITLQGLQGWRALRPAPTPLHEAPAPARPQSDPPSLATIIGAHLFGSAPVERSVDASIVFGLTGTLAAKDPKQGFAIIAAQGHPAQVYAIGATLPGGALLAEVHDARAIIDKGGVFEELRLPLDRNALVGLVAGGTAAAANAGAATAAPASKPAGSELARNSVLAALPYDIDVVRTLRPKAVIADGAVTGYEINAIQPERLGMRHGDRLVAVNGEHFKDAETAAKVFGQLSESNATTADFTVLRGGEAVRVTVPIESLRRRRP
jgi:type II secretion system protein C